MYVARSHTPQTGFQWIGAIIDDIGKLVDIGGGEQGIKLERAAKQERALQQSALERSRAIHASMAAQLQGGLGEWTPPPEPPSVERLPSAAQWVLPAVALGAVVWMARRRATS